MENVQGELLLHYERFSDVEAFDYIVYVPQAGDYKLTADVVTINMDQSFLLAVNDAATPIKVKLPHTVGMWGTSQPAVVSLVQGQMCLASRARIPIQKVVTPGTATPTTIRTVAA